MIPLRDDNPAQRAAVVTRIVILLNVLVFMVELSAGPMRDEFLREWGVVPGRLFAALSGDTALPVELWTLVTSQFLHGGWLHLIGNMVFLWVFGNNIEDVMGHGRFLVFYLVCGVAAAGAQILISPNSVVPMVGASGAISGVLGAYLLLYPRVRVHTLLFLGLFVTTVTLPAYVMLGYWAVLQLLGGLGSLGGVERGGTAFFAHIGGFVAGLILIRFFASEDALRRRPQAPASYYRYRTYG